jgi:hypothetical protein
MKFHIRQAIVTKFLSATHTKSSRVKASSEAGSIITEWDDMLNVEENHRKCADALFEKLGWHKYNRIVACGSIKTGFVFVLGEI